MIDNFIHVLLAVVGVIIPLIVVYMYLSLRYQHKESKINTVRLVLHMQKRFTKTDFRNVVKFLNTGEKPTEWNKDLEIRKMMNYFEYMGMFENDGVLEWKYIKCVHGHVLNKLKTHPDSKRLLEEWVNKDPKFYFIYIRKMFDKIAIDYTLVD